jgi:hypothetical protein
MLLAQLIDVDELMDLSPEELREMLVKLDDEVVQARPLSNKAVVVSQQQRTVRTTGVNR